MRDDGGLMRPVDLWARLDVSLEIVGVQLDQSGHHQIALAVHGPCGYRSARCDLGDATVPQTQRSRQHLIWQDKGSVGQNRVGHEVGFRLALEGRSRCNASGLSHACDSARIGPAP
jgi:hypothetical protein